MAIADDELLAGRYRLRSRIVSATLADLRYAHDEVLDRTVVVKLARLRDLQPGFYTHDLALKESRTASRLEHPHILPIYDFGSHDDCSFIVMRRFTETLRQHLQRVAPAEFPSSAFSVRILGQVASAVDYLHEHGPVVHANLKPENILIDSESGTQVHAYVSDFGVAALGLRNVGTPAYMAPEYAMRAAEIGPAVDRYALGVIAFECFTCRNPFDDMSAVTMFAQKLNPPQDLYSARRHRPDLPPGVDVALGRLMRADPSERYATATEAVENIARAFHAGHAAVAGPVFLSYARADETYAHALAAELRAAGVELWVDRDIRPGTNWDEAVEAALARCRTMLVVMSPAAAASDTVRDEWNYFLEHDKPVHPFILQPCDTPFRLRRRQYVTSSGDLLNDLARVVEMLGRVANAPTDR